MNWIDEFAKEIKDKKKFPLNLKSVPVRERKILFRSMINVLETGEEVNVNLVMNLYNNSQ